MTGLRLNEFAFLFDDMLSRFVNPEQARLERRSDAAPKVVVGTLTWRRVTKS
jgi:hypothetical protein